jgi:hypothetical protein
MEIIRLLAASTLLLGPAAPVDAALLFGSSGKITFRSGNALASELIGQGSHDFSYSGSIDHCYSLPVGFRKCRINQVRMSIDGVDVTNQFLLSPRADVYGYTDGTFYLNVGASNDTDSDGMEFSVRSFGDFSLGQRVTKFGDPISASFTVYRNDRLAYYAIDSLAQSARGRVTVAVPEPTSWAMLITGLGAAGCLMRRTRRSKTRSPDRTQRASQV